MPSIKINQINKTNQTPASSTIVQMTAIIGAATKGALNTPTECYTLNSFYSTFGSVPPAFNTLSWIAAKKLLLAGMPVLYTRIAKYEEEATGIATVKLNSGESVATVRVDANSPGTWGNSITVEVAAPASTGLFTLKVYYGGELVSQLSCSTVSTDSNYVDKIASNYVTLSDVRTSGKGTAVQMTATPSPVSLTSGSDGSEMADSDIVSAAAPFISNVSPNNALLADKTLYEFAFFVIPGLSADGYEKGSTTSAIDFATLRDDCVVILDPSQSIVTSGDAIQWAQGIVNERCTTFFPWVKMYVEDYGESMWLPPSIAYLEAVATAQRTYSPWYAVAGPTRGALPNVSETAVQLGQGVSENLNDALINPISKYRNYGYVINGNNILNSAATSRTYSQLSVRMAINAAVSSIFSICQSLTFQPNTSVLWAEFTGRVTQVLDGMKATEGITRYEVTMDDTTMTAADRNNGRVRGVVKIWPALAAEEFVIDFEIANETV